MLTVLANSCIGMCIIIIIFYALICSAVEISFTEDDYRANEPDLTMPIVVTKNLRIASRLELDVVPLTVQQAESSTPRLLPANILEDNQLSPPYAGMYNTNILFYLSSTFEANTIIDMYLA